MPTTLNEVIDVGKITLAHADEISSNDPPGGNHNQFMLYVCFPNVDVQGFTVPFVDVVSDAVTTCVEWAESKDEILRMATSLETGAKAMLEGAERLRVEAATAEEGLAD